MKKIIFSLLVCTLCVACSPKYITKEIPVEVIKEIPVEVVKTEYINNSIVDSTFVKEFCDRYFKGDTVVIYKDRQVIKYKYHSDTIVVRDTIPTIIKSEVPIPIKEQIVKEVPKLYWYQRMFMYLGIFISAFIVIVLCIKYIKR